MGELGSIFTEDEATGSPSRGEDLYFVVEVPRSEIGDDAGFVAEIPLEIDKDGVMVRRAVVDGDDDGVPLHLPADFPSGRTLRLRRQGGTCEGGVPGDLFVKVELVGSARALAPRSDDAVAVPPSLTPWVIGAGVFALVALGFAYLALL
jgi:hypothetical protein